MSARSARREIVERSKITTIKCTPRQSRILRRLSEGSGFIVVRRQGAEGDIKAYYIWNISDDRTVVVYMYAKNYWTEFSIAEGEEVPGIDAYAPELMRNLAANMGFEIAVDILDRLGRVVVGRFLGYASNSLVEEMADPTLLDFWGRLVEFRIQGLNDEMEHAIRKRIREGFVAKLYGQG